jgi:3-hydroxyisobutyrate dehydrogenase-like beta-hydroxyacid dehydrogenase
VRGDQIRGVSHLAPAVAEADILAVTYGGDAVLLEEFRPVVACFADSFTGCGPVGAAHRAKLVSNFIALGNAALICEAMAEPARQSVTLARLTGFEDAYVPRLYDALCKLSGVEPRD